MDPQPYTADAQDSRSRREESVFVIIISAWLFAILYFDPRILALWMAKTTLLGKLAVLVFVGCLNFFWFFTIYYSVVIIVSAWLRRKKSPDLPPVVGPDFPAVALLYPTRNDFREDAVEALTRMDYPNFHVFILDDSTMEEYQRHIDSWASGREKLVSVIRRPVHHGFKAGNLNHGLRQISDQYPYFAVCDDDNIFPPNFIRGLLPYFEADPKAAFVQARQDGNPNQSEYFGQAMGCVVAVHFRHYVRARQSYGFVMFYGHGALLRTSVWKEAGGFPEIVTEDLSYSAKVRTMGYHGVFTEKVICFEDYPPTYAQLRKRTEKWIRGTAEFLKLYYPSFWRSPKVPWFEKLDVLAHAVTHFASVPTLIFLFILGTILPASFDQFRYPGSFFFMPVPEGKSAFSYLVHVRYHIFWSLDFFIMMMLAICLPTIPVVLDLAGKPIRMLRFIVIANFIYLGSLISETLSLAAFLITGKAYFRNTHDASETKGRFLKDIFSAFHPNHPLVWMLELLTGAFFMWICWRTKNLWFSVPGTALLLDPWMHWIGWEKRWIRALTFIPFFIGVFIIGVVTMDLVVSLYYQWVNRWPGDGNL